MARIEADAGLSNPTCPAVGHSKQVGMAPEISFVLSSQAHRLLALHAGVLQPLLHQLQEGDRLT